MIKQKGPHLQRRADPENFRYNDSYKRPTLPKEGRSGEFILVPA